MKTRLIAGLALASLLLGGCASRFELPAISGDSITYKRSDPLGGTTITASGVQVTDSEVKAERAEFNVIYPSFSVSLTVENYKRARK